VKNTLVQKALAGMEGEGASSLFVGPIGIAYAPDPVSAAKISVEFAKINDNFEIVGGLMGSVVLDAKGVGALATLPSLDQIRSKLIGLLQAPATKVAGVLQAPAAQLARVFSAYAAKDAA
jgi:large subunit ribosomal protein L10